MNVIKQHQNDGAPNTTKVTQYFDTLGLAPTHAVGYSTLLALTDTF